MAEEGQRQSQESCVRRGRWNMGELRAEYVGAKEGRG